MQLCLTTILPTARRNWQPCDTIVILIVSYKRVTIKNKRIIASIKAFFHGKSWRLRHVVQTKALQYEYNNCVTNWPLHFATM